MKGRIVLVCGGRAFADFDALCDALDAEHAAEPIALVVHGDAAGADRLGEQWAGKRGIHVAIVPAQWGRYGTRAGPMRNEAMARFAPVLDKCVAFPGGRGTAHMIGLCVKLGVPVATPLR